MVARQSPKKSGLWWNIAICHAAAAEDPLAVEALKAAAANEPDFESSVDCLVLSRQLRVPAANAKVQQLSAKYVVESVSKLLTALDQQPEFVRIEREDEPEGDGIVPRTVAVYQILDRNPSLVANADLSAANVAHVLGDLAIFDRSEDEPARAFVAGLGQERLTRVTSAFTAAVGVLARVEGEPRIHGYLRAEHIPLVQDWFFPADLSRSQMNELGKSFQRRIVDEVWPNTAAGSVGWQDAAGSGPGA